MIEYDGDYILSFISSPRKSSTTDFYVAFCPTNHETEHCTAIKHKIIVCGDEELSPRHDISFYKIEIDNEIVAENRPM